MRIVVCVKYVPDSQAQRRFVDADNTVDREGVDGILSELDEYAVEEAVKIAEAGDHTVIALTVGPEGANDALRKALQMGADEAVLVSDAALHGSDAAGTAKALAAALKAQNADLVLTGMASTDAGTSLVPAMTAELLGIPQVTFANEVNLSDSGVQITRDTDTETQTIEAALPALVSVTDQCNEPRYPSFKGIMAAKKKPVSTLSLADIGVDAAEVGLGGAWTTVAAVAARPARTAGEIVTDEGDGGTKLVEFLAGAKII